MSQERTKSNTIFIGKKPVMNYVTAALTLFESGYAEISLKARGRAISRAVDTAEILRRSFLKEVGVKDIRISTEEFTEENRKRQVSAIEIVLGK
jgi:DNA-binding protein